MGSLLWSMVIYNQPNTEIKFILNEGLKKYPNLKEKINDSTIGTGKAFWGKLLIDGHYMLSTIYAKLYNYSYLIARMLYRLSKK